MSAPVGMQTLARVVIYVTLVVSAMGCHVRSELSSEESQLARVALSYVLAKRPYEGGIAICFPDRTGPPTELLDQMRRDGMSVASCPFWRHQLLRKNQWELDVYAFQVLNDRAWVRIAGTEPAGHHGGHHSLRYERGEASWRLTESTFGIP
jgi:hypothetical protein